MEVITLFFIYRCIFYRVVFPCAYILSEHLMWQIISVYAFFVVFLYIRHNRSYLSLIFCRIDAIVFFRSELIAHYAKLGKSFLAE